MEMTAKDFLDNVQWSRKDLISTEGLTLREIGEIFSLADIFKAEIKKAYALSTKRSCFFLYYSHGTQTHALRYSRPAFIA